MSNSEKTTYNKSPGQRGKWAEAKVRDLLKKLGEESALFDWERILDARSAGGRFRSQIGDFAVFMPKLHGVIEVKEVDHDYRLPHKNFDAEAIGKLYKRQLAGGKVWIVVAHKRKAWRLVPFEVFRTRTGGSWDLREFPTYTKVDEILVPELKSRLEEIRSQQ